MVTDSVLLGSAGTYSCRRGKISDVKAYMSTKEHWSLNVMHGHLVKISVNDLVLIWVVKLWKEVIPQPSYDMVTAAMKLKDACSLEEKL